ncbi:hypothetical protein AGABI1DRAFT_37284 [Agaricus bisporus var. burnettii JB137-S8]|uniref:Lysophospholipase n=1 Tax=Agaricus bisporus var. burnettii (strain JB137-S8 / ATCC MYA-4627 / FGSC 10392) TaxID=597362 RepID=K5XC74_AGABU|nr:uncharacterized protein AGABI1DRAFT_37284 [Agaricus bisporus var. burnettii JB137-S8]EKM80903.1 hypothetical protein AGABI1DRAFT_37284 [Agaricus bisporus var. burnettii JB137-S8]
MFRAFLLLSSLLVSFSVQETPPDPSQDSITDYAPQVNVECPDISKAPLIRTWDTKNQSIHPQEEEYLKKRAEQVLPQAWNDWLGNGSRMGYDLSDHNISWPKIGLALPGGGLRAALFAAGSLSGLDARNETAKNAGTGGLLQVASYISGLSGSMYFNDFPTLHDLVLGIGDNLGGWALDFDFATPDGPNLFSTQNQAWFGSLLWSVRSKADKGINFFTNDTAHGAGQLWSKTSQIPSVQQFKTPFPIIVADARPVGSNLTTTLDLQATVYEITPVEFASFDPSLSAGMNMTYAGTHLSNGFPDNGTACVTGFDQVGFMMGTSASLFNQILDFAGNAIQGWSQSDTDGLLYILGEQLKEVRTRADDVANWPNPFKGINPDTFQDANAAWLELIDGSSNLENIPYNPLFIKSRGLDVIVTIEGSADDIHNFPNGTGNIFTKERLSTILKDTHQPFPPIPSSIDEFVSTGVNGRATFFGCDPPNPSAYPMVIYLPNAPPINGDDPITNTATFQLVYTLKHVSLFLDSAQKLVIEGFTPNANTPDPNFGACLQCAVFDRARMKATPSFDRSDICKKCFQQYCFDPENPPSRSELPNRKFDFVDPDPQGLASFFSRNKFKFLGGVIGLVVLIILLVVGLWVYNLSMLF